MQPDFSTKHTARVKPLQYIAQNLYEWSVSVIAAVAAVICLTRTTAKAQRKKTPSIEKPLLPFLECLVYFLETLKVEVNRHKVKAWCVCIGVLEKSQIFHASLGISLSV